MTDIFPPFTALKPAPEYLKLFFVKSRRASTVVNPKVVVSTSLFWGVCYFHENLPEVGLDALFSRKLIERKNGETWWNTYMKPMLIACDQKLPEGWQRRVHLSADLEFLTDLFPPAVEVVVMKEKSPTSVPGMMWRYLPMQEPVFCVARGADNFWLPQKYMDALHTAILLKADLLRTSFEMDLAYQKKFHLRPILGSCAIQGPLPFLHNVTAWIKTMKETPGKIPVYYKELEQTAMYQWDAFGQDEQFLQHWLYHHLAQSGNIILTDPMNRTSPNFTKDVAYLESRGVQHHTFFP